MTNIAEAEVAETKTISPPYINPIGIYKNHSGRDEDIDREHQATAALKAT